MLATLVKPPVNRTGGGTPGYGGVLFNHKY
jgi:hypothetical protein